MRRFGLLAIMHCQRCNANSARTHTHTQTHTCASSDKAAKTVRSYVTSPSMYSAEQNSSSCRNDKKVKVLIFSMIPRFPKEYSEKNLSQCHILHLISVHLLSNMLSTFISSVVTVQVSDPQVRMGRITVTSTHTSWFG